MYLGNIFAKIFHYFSSIANSITFTVYSKFFNSFCSFNFALLETILKFAIDNVLSMGTIDDDFRIRRLTPTECFRLQGFPDGMIQQARELGISDSQLYKMAGNAVTVNVAQAVAQKIWEVEYGT